MRISTAGEPTSTKKKKPRGLAVSKNSQRGAEAIEVIQDICLQQ